MVTLIEVTEPVMTTDASALTPSYSHSILPTVCIPTVCVGYAVVDDVPAFNDLYRFPLYFTLSPEP